jgi:hypothetical protein
MKPADLEFTKVKPFQFSLPSFLGIYVQLADLYFGYVQPGALSSLCLFHLLQVVAKKSKTAF